MRLRPPPSHARRVLAGTLLLAVLVAGAGAPVAAQAPVADLTVVAYGPQRLDLATGRTVLEAGGEVVDVASGVRLRATWIAYVDGVELEARDATVEGDLGLVRADAVWIDLASGRVRAEGAVTLARDGLVAGAERLGLDAAAGLAWLEGAVTAERPEAAAAAVWIDVTAGRLLLVGPYRYVDGPFVLEGGPDATLQLDPVDGDVTAGFDARSEVDPDFAARVAEIRADAEAE